ncbi:MAG TPA: type IV pilus assembly protein PilM [Chthoniobacteraceae bacterium]|nr:type IV pilus assembly protein PilM [Verrucomicrobiae bacterium]HWB59323.1 type IV pilus assembly protein PilM [Chthoniobacteraceae bacterium]
MAAPNRILSLNLGLQTVGLAEFRNTPSGGLVLQAYRLTELVADPAADSSRPSQMKIAIEEMMGHLKAKSGKVNYAISAQSVFTRFVKLPPVDAEQVDQIIKFEAQQNVPFPIDEVVWDYQLVAGAEGGDNKLEVVLVAIKSDLLDDLNGAVEQAGLSTNIVDVAPMALYNAFRYNYSDLTGCTLLIDIGARTTNLIFADGKKVFSRSIPIGGTTITAGIAKDFNEPVGASEERKKKVGFVSLGGAYAEPSDPEVSRVSKIIRNTMTRLHAEISRSISFYRSQQQGNQPVRVFLCGGSSSLPYMREFFHEKLQLPIEFFNALRNVTVAKGVNGEEAGKSAHVLGELVGLALRSVSDCPMELSLRPESVIKAESLSKRRPAILMTGICILLIMAGFIFYYWRAADIEQNVTQTVKKRSAPLTVIAGKMDGVKKDLVSLASNSGPFQEAVSDREYWAKVLTDINQRLPHDNIWVSSFQPGFFSGTFPDVKFTPATDAMTTPPKNQKFGIQVQGYFLDPSAGANLEAQKVVYDFKNNLEASPYVTPEVQNVNTTVGEYLNKDYLLNLYLKTPFTLK